MLNGSTPIITAPLESWTELQDEAITNLRRQSLTSSGASSALAKFSAGKVKAEAEDACLERHVDIDHYNAILTTFWHTMTGRMLGPLVRRVAQELGVDHVRVEGIVHEIIEDVSGELNAAIEARTKLDRIEAGRSA